MAALLFCGTLTGFAQSQGDFRFGITGGLNLSNITDLQSDCRIGFNAGVKVDYGFTNEFYGTSGLIFTQKGAKDEEDGMKAEVNPLYLSIPIYAGYRHNVGNGLSIFGELGPYVAFGIAGKTKLTEKESGTELESKTDFFDSAKNVDAGIGLRAGIEISKFQIHLGYEYGFCKVFDEGSNHNSNFNVGVSYMF